MGLEAIAQMIAGIGAAARGTASDLKAATEAAHAYGKATVQAGIANNGVTVTNLGATASSLGDPRDATEQAARMVAAIQNATGR